MTKIQQANKSVATITDAANEVQRRISGLPERVRTWLADIPRKADPTDLWSCDVPNAGDRPEVSPEEEEQIRAITLAMENVTSPATRGQVFGHVMKLMHHGFLLDVDERMADVILDDWIEGIGEYPNWCIAEACRLWRRTKPGQRPGPGHIRNLCRMVFDRECRPLQALKQLVDGASPRPDYVKLSWRHNPGHPDSDFCGPKWVDEFGRPVTRTGELLDITPYTG